jgi:hypothetical protein
MQMIWLGWEGKYFLTRDWTTQITLMALPFLSFCRMTVGARKPETNSSIEGVPLHSHRLRAVLHRFSPRPLMGQCWAALISRA